MLQRALKYHITSWNKYSQTNDFLKIKLHLTYLGSLLYPLLRKHGDAMIGAFGVAVHKRRVLLEGLCAFAHPEGLHVYQGGGGRGRDMKYLIVQILHDKGFEESTWEAELKNWKRYMKKKELHVEGSVTQRHNSISAILRKSGLCVTEHLAFNKELSLCFTSHWLQWGVGWS